MKVWIQSIEVSPITGQPVAKTSVIEGDECEVLGCFLLVRSGEHTILFPMTSIIRVDDPVFPVIEEEGESEEVISYG